MDPVKEQEKKDKSERLIEAASAILAAAQGGTLKAVVLNKALFYLDLSFLRDHGTTVTGNTYLALEMGPVVAKYQTRLISKLEERGIAKQTEEPDASKPIRLVRAPEYVHLSPSELERAATVGAFFSGVTSIRASNLSHDNLGWKMARERMSASGPPCPIDMFTALQQLVDDDPWMSEPLTAEESDFVEADAGIGEEW